MHAHDRFLPEWFNRIRSRQITLPRFQRFAAWGHSEVSGLLTTVLRGLPSGAALILEVGDSEKFKSRTIADGPESSGRSTEQLLDGQQRLTALWRSLHDKYSDRTYLIGFQPDDENPAIKHPYAYGESRWLKNNGRRRPVWVDEPSDCWKRGFIPARLLRPEDISTEIDQWIEAAIGDIAQNIQEYRRIKNLLDDLRTRVREFNLPYLALPASTPKEVALDVFIKMNTSSVRLSAYDIIVALVEDETGQSLHDHVDQLRTEVPRVSAYGDPAELVLDVVALRQDRIPGQQGYKGIDFSKMLTEWEQLIRSIRGLISFLEDECIFDEQRLPSYIPLPVIAALWECLPTQPDKLGNAKVLLRQYLWRSFLTTRYEQSSNSNALQDYRGLRKALIECSDPAAIPIFAIDLPTKEQLLLTAWPKGRTIVGRGLLALQLNCGAEDLADGARASIATITSKEHPREYHHLFPASTLEESGLESEQIYKALNCALITWRTNRVISNKSPLTYLKERADNCSLGEDELRRRLKTHLIPYDELAVGYDGLDDNAKSEKVKSDYEKFLSARADILIKAVVAACEGRALDPEKFISQADAKAA